MIRILVTGANGQLGSEIKQIQNDYPDYQFIYTDYNELDITKRETLHNYFKENNIDFVINCAAYTAVDKAEQDQDQVFLLNQTAVRNLVYCAEKYNLKLIHISTDYVFDGKSYKPYKENDRTNPLSIYGKSKYTGEQEIIGNKAKAVVIRTSWLYSSFGKNFVKTIIKLAKERDQLNVVADQIGSPTYAKDLAKVILTFVALDDNSVFNNKEVFHFSNLGVCSWYDFARKIVEYKNLVCKISPIESFEYPTPAPRPHYSVLNTSKIRKQLNIEVPHWEDSLKKMLQNI